MGYAHNHVALQRKKKEIVSRHLKNLTFSHEFHKLVFQFIATTPSPHKQNTVKSQQWNK